jgi:hypothetical protein
VTPTQRSLAKLRADGWTTAIVEHWNAHARIRQDLFGFIDILALRDGETLAVQATSGSSVAARVAKIAASETAPIVRKAGWRIEVWGWRKNAAGKHVLRVEDVS